MQGKYYTIDSSTLSRTTQKYFDRIFKKENIGYTQAFLLTNIYEDEGICMNNLALKGGFDKATITKSVQKLIDNDYVRIEVDQNDKRQKNLFTTKKSQELIPRIYLVLQDWHEILFKGLSEQEIETFRDISTRISERALDYEQHLDSDDRVHFFGLQKLSLVDYPGKMVSTLFTGGCNFRCPFCHNRSLVFLNDSPDELDQFEILRYLNKRSDLIDGVCITGGEPLLHDGLKEFIAEVKKFGLLVKLDTNGSRYHELKDLIDSGLIDYIAMDIKNSEERYLETVGLNEIEFENIKKSIHLIMNSGIDYEFRTTYVKEFHDEQSAHGIGQLIKGAKNYYIQSFEDDEQVIQPGLHSLDKETLVKFKEIMEGYVDHVELRGIE